MRAKTSAVAGKLIFWVVRYFCAEFLLQGVLLVPSRAFPWHELNDVRPRLDDLHPKACCLVKFG